MSPNEVTLWFFGRNHNWPRNQVKNKNDKRPKMASVLLRIWTKLFIKISKPNCLNIRIVCFYFHHVDTHLSTTIIGLCSLFILLVKDCTLLMKSNGVLSHLPPLSVSVDSSLFPLKLPGLDWIFCTLGGQSFSTYSLTSCSREFASCDCIWSYRSRHFSVLSPRLWSC